MKYQNCDIAFSHVVLPDGTSLRNEIVSFNKQGKPTRHRPLTEEEPFIEWHDTTFCFPK